MSIAFSLSIFHACNTATQSHAGHSTVRHSTDFKSFKPPSTRTSIKAVQSPGQVKMTTPKKPTEIRAVLFDLDGTCVNSDHIHFETYRDTLLELVPSFNKGQVITRELYDTQMSGRQNPELVASILPELSETERTHIWQTKEARYEEIIMRGVDPIHGLIPLIRQCKKNGIQIFIVTNAPKGSCLKTMGSIGIDSYFQRRCIVVAEECEFAKPHPAPYLRALELAGVPAECAIAFEDSPSGTIAAIGAGLYTIGMCSTQPEQVLLNAGASLTINDYEDSKLNDLLSQYNIQ